MSEINGKTKITGIIGYPLTYTLSPVMHNRAFDVCNLNFRYLPFVVEKERLGHAADGIRALQIRGVNVTMPHKETVMQFLDELSPQAELIGAVNTIVNENGYLIGHNTDGAGFLRSLEDESYNPRDKSVIVLGTGGAAKAVAVALAQAGIKNITIVGRSIEKAEAIKSVLLRSFKEISVRTLTFSDNLADTFLIGELVVNATPIGMDENGDSLPVPLELINATHFVYDLIYVPLETVLIKEARNKGARVANGLGMLLYQAAIAYELWTGTSAPVQEMSQALILELEGGDRLNNAKEKEIRRISTRDRSNHRGPTQ